MARRTKYTTECVKKLTDAIKLGATYELACGYAGIHIDTFCDWRNRKAEFSEAVALAEGSGAVQCLLRIQKGASDGDWRAAAWILEHRHPEQYGRQVIENYRRDVVARIAEAEGVDAAKLYDLAFEREKRRTG